jgi:hypothetical protein
VKLRKLAAVVFSLLILAPHASLVRAQSGRNRGVPTAGKPGGNPVNQPANQPSADSRASESGAETSEVVDSEVVRVDTAIVTIPVSVRDRQGRYAPDLRREDFRVFEDGAEQQIAYFAAVDQPFTVALVLDTSGSSDFSLSQMQSAAAAFVEQLKPADRVMVISFDDGIDVLTEPTGDRQELNRAIRRARGEAYLTELAQRTGGRLYRGNSVVNISQAFAWVADELRRQYSLGYYPKSSGRDGQRRQIKVQVSQPNLVVQARDGYVYSQRKAEAGGKEAEPATQPESPRRRFDGIR